MTDLKNFSAALERESGRGNQNEGKSVLITGGAGYIGSHTAKALHQAGFQPVTFDNLSTGHRSAVKWGSLIVADLADIDSIRAALRENRIAAVVHCAGSALVGESMKDPGLYFRNNTAATANLLEAMSLENVPNLVFSSTCAVYGTPQFLPITEDHPTQPVNPYGESKLAAERQIRWYGATKNLAYVALRYFNAAGADPDGEIGENHNPETHLIPLAIEATYPGGNPLGIYGFDYPTPDGTAIRDYIHVSDLAQAHVAAVRYLLMGGKSETLNLGTGKGTSVLEIVRTLEKIAGREVAVQECARREGDPEALVANATKANRTLGWTTRSSDLDQILNTALAWREKQSSQTRGARGKVAVIGAGPAGLTAAYQLAKAGVAVDVYEAGPQVGGMSRTIELWDQLVDIGPHRFFSTDQRVNRLWLEVAGTKYKMVDRTTRILYKNSFFNYPITAMDALQKLGIFEAAHCVLSYLYQLAFPVKDTRTFEDWVTKAFGRRLYEIFFKSYSEKLWGISCRDLDADFAAQRIKKFSLSAAIKSALGLTGGKKHKTLVDRFAYPDEGTGQIYDEMARRIREMGGNIMLRTPVAKVEIQGGKVNGLHRTTGEFVAYDEVVSTMPLTAVVRAIEEAPQAVQEHVKQLKFRNTILVYLHVDGEELFPDNWLYIHSPELQTGRITNFQNWGEGIRRGRKSTILCLEYWCNDDDAMWKMTDEELSSLAEQEILKTGLTKSAPILDSYICRVPRSYPVYSAGYKDHLRPIEAYLSTIRGFHAIGRYGAFKYNNQDHSILMGILAAEKIVNEGAVHDLWAVNTDYEVYQEASTIDETGLVLSR